MIKSGPSTIARRALLSLPLILLVSGCALGPNYRRPSVNAPTVYRGQPGSAQQASLVDLPWWELFKDETLKQLVKTSLANNYDLAAAVARVEQARQVATEARAQYFPAINYLSITSYGHNQFINSPASNSPGAVVLQTWKSEGTESWIAPIMRRLESRIGPLRTEAVQQLPCGSPLLPPNVTS